MNGEAGVGERVDDVELALAVLRGYGPVAAGTAPARARRPETEREELTMGRPLAIGSPLLAGAAVLFGALAAATCLAHVGR